MNARTVTAEAIAQHRKDFAALTDEELLAITWQDASDPPKAIAAKQELEARRERAEESRHMAALSSAADANVLAKWAIVIATGALIVSVVQVFW